MTMTIINLLETALLKVQCETADTLDKPVMTALIMLDLSPAFDVINH